MVAARTASYVRGIAPDPENREANDFYPTPASGTRALLSVERFAGNIWEPACGDGAISRVLEAEGYAVSSSDLIDRGYGSHGVDFLESRGDKHVANIVTNPPFKFAQQFSERALAPTTGKVAMLCRLAWLEGAKRRQMFEATPLARVWVFSKRLTMLRGGWDGGKGGGSMTAFAWFVWEHGHTGPASLGWIDPIVQPEDNLRPTPTFGLTAASEDVTNNDYEARLLAEMLA